jgi:hypothetical protein
MITTLAHSQKKKAEWAVPFFYAIQMILFSVLLIVILYKVFSVDDFTVEKIANF